MPPQIVLQKWPDFPFSSKERKLFHLDIIRNKVSGFKHKLLSGSRNNSRFKNRTTNRPNFRKNWLCQGCLYVFDLKPLRCRKSLMIYNLICPRCKKSNVTHNDQISMAIYNKLSINAICNYSEKDLVLEIELTSKSKYIPILIEKKKKIECDKEVFQINEIEKMY